MLPPNRQDKKIGDIALIKSGKRLPKGFSVQDKKTNYPYIRVSDFGSDGTIDESNIKYISEEVYNQISKYIITDQDLYISIAGTIGKTGIIPSSLNGANLTENAVRLVYKNVEEINNEYVLYFTKSGLFAEQAGLATRTVAMPKLAISRLENILIPLPPLPIQHKIVEKLDEASAQITASKLAIQSQLDALDQLWQSSLSDVFENDEYELVKLNDIFDVRDGTHDSPKFYDTGYPLITSKNLKEDGLETTNVKYISEEDYHAINLRSKVDKGDLLFAMIGTIGNPTIIQEQPNFAIKNVALFKPKSNQGNMEYLRYFLLAQKTINKMTNESKGATQKFVGLGYLRSFQIPLPDLATETRIVSQLDDLSQNIAALRSQYTTQLQHFDDLRASILDQAFRGLLTD